MSKSATGTPKAKMFDSKDKENIDDAYPDYTMLHDWEGVAEHKEKKYLRTLLVYRENTEYFPETEEKHEVCYIIPAQIMAYIIVHNTYEVLYPNPKDKSNRILCPKDVQSMYDAEDAVKMIARNAKIGAYFAKFPYMPMQHNLPIVRMLDEDHSFHKWKPQLPVQADWRVFIYAPTNIRYKKVTYAANCRHKTGAWDEHPWCAACLIQAGIKPCVHPDKRTPEDEVCYICAKMTREAIIAFLNRINDWKKPDKSGKVKKPKSRLLPTRIKCQVHADLANAPEAEGDLNPACAKGTQGICRPATSVPMYAVMEEFMKWSSSQRASAVKRHMRFFKQRYDEDRAHYGTDKPQWPSLKTWEIMGTRTFQERSDDEEEEKGDEEPKSDEEEIENSQDEEEIDDGAGDGSSKKPIELTHSQSASPKKRRKLGLATRKRETKSQRYQRLLREKENELSTMRADLRSVRRELKETKQQKASAKQTYEWKANSTMCTVPSSNNYKTYDYQRALQAAGRMTEDVKMQDPVEPAEKRRKLMQRSLLKNTKKVFVADEDILRKVDKSLANYAEDPWQPEFELCIDACLTDFVPSKILTEPPLAEPDKKGKRPDDESAVVITQKEVIRLEALNRAMIKIHEMDEAFISALLEKMDLSELQEGQEPDKNIVLDAMRQSHLCKEDLLAEATAITIATRRRDNVMRQDISDFNMTGIVAHAILPEEKSLLMREPQPQPGTGPSRNRKNREGSHVN